MSYVKKDFVMTTSWDDGHPLDLRVADLLAECGLAGTFYVPRGSQRPVMRSSQIHELSKSFEIGAHTLDHVEIDRLSDADARAQLSGSRKWIEDLTGTTCSVFCFPGGKFRGRQLHLVRQAGFQAARTVELLSIERPAHVNGLQLIPTTIQAFPHGACAYARNAAKRYFAAQFVNLSAAIHSSGWISLAEEMLNRAMENGGVFHLWGHSWEIEEKGEWGNLEALLKTMSAYRGQPRSVTNRELCEHASLTVSTHFRHSLDSWRGETRMSTATPLLAERVRVRPKGFAASYPDSPRSGLPRETHMLSERWRAIYGNVD